MINSCININMNNKPQINVALKKFIPDVEVFAYAETIQRNTKEYVNNLLLETAKGMRPDLIMMEHHDYGSITLETIKKLKEYCNLIISWTGDIIKENETPKWYYELAEQAVTCYSNDTDVSNVSNKGFPAYFLNHYHEDLYQPLNTEKDIYVIYIANKFNRYPNSVLRDRMVEQLHQKYGSQFRLFGNHGWDKKYNAQPISRESSVSFYNRSKIAISMSNLDRPHYVSDRLFHILGSGTFCLCHRFEGCEDFFTDGVHVKYFNNTEELLVLCDYYLNEHKGGEQREQIAKEGRKRCIDLFGDDAFNKKIQEIYNTHKK